jgi:hypothetical protein
MSYMNDKKEMLDVLAKLELAIKELRQELMSDVPFDQLIDRFKPNLDNLFAIFSPVEQEQERDLEQKRNVLNHIAHFIHEKVDRREHSLEISQSAAYFLCQENDPHLQIEETPSQQTKQVMLEAKECLIAVKVKYERLTDYELCSRKTELFFINANDEKPTLKVIDEEVTWDSLTADLRDIFITQGQSKVSFQIYPLED